MEINWKSTQNFNEFQLEISMKYSGNPLENQLKFNRCFNEIPMAMNQQCKSVGVPIEISMKYRLKFKRNDNGNFNETPMEIQWKSS